MIQAVSRAKRAGIKSSVIVLIGLGGKELSSLHARKTAEALNRMQPHYLSFLTLIVIPGTPLYRDACSGRFRLLSPRESLAEMEEIISCLNLEKTIFRSNHASSYLPLAGRFPNDSERLLSVIRRKLESGQLKPEMPRGL